ncbi:hypothetical protein [Halosimplex sp. J119]
MTADKYRQPGDADKHLADWRFNSATGSALTTERTDIGGVVKEKLQSDSAAELNTGLSFQAIDNSYPAYDLVVVAEGVSDASDLLMTLNGKSYSDSYEYRNRTNNNNQTGQSHWKVGDIRGTPAGWQWGTITITNRPNNNTSRFGMIADVATSDNTIPGYAGRLDADEGLSSIELFPESGMNADGEIRAVLQGRTIEES